MNKCHSPIGWHNDTAPALNETNLNYMDGCIDTIDDRVVSIDTTKANQSDLLQTVKGVTYNTTTGVITITWWNNTTFQIDLNIEKIPVNFTMSASGIITMTTADGTQYTADVSAVMKLYTFVDSDEISFNVVQNGNNYTVTASIVEGSITADKLQPNFLADCEAAQEGAETAATASNANKLASEGWAVGKQNGVDVPSTSPYYHNNAQYYKEQAQAIVGTPSLSSLSDVSLVNPQNDQFLKYNGTLNEWVNADGVNVVDSLTSTSSTDALSAKQGKVINDSLAAEIAKKGQANGYAELDNSGRIPYSQLPESAMEYKGTWNAATNTPTLAQGVGTNGDMYIVSTGGTRFSITWVEGDRAIFDGTTQTWQRIAGSAVMSVAGKTGAVTLVKADITDFPTSMTPTAHNHSASEITSGTLAVARGGTGKTSVSDTSYTTLNYRGESLNSSDTTPASNGCIAWKYA